MRPFSVFGGGAKCPKLKNLRASTQPGNVCAIAKQAPGRWAPTPFARPRARRYRVGVTESSERPVPDPSSSVELHDALRLHQLVQTCQDAVLFIDGEGMITLANPACKAIFGYEPQALLGRDVRMLMAEPYASRHRDYVARYENTGERRAIGRIRQVTALRADGEEFPIELSVTQLAQSGDSTRYGAFIRDVSDKVRLQGALMERERSATVGTTASMLVHEIANPLNNMALQLQALRRKVSRVESGQEGVKKVDACLEEIERLSRLVQEFRALSGRRRIVRRPLVLTELLEAVLANMVWMHKGVLVRREFHDEAVRVMVDADKIQQVILNLCHNAIEAMPKGGELTLRTSSSGDQFLLEVCDTGEGVLPGLDIFEPFVTSKPQGTGLGLAICAEIVREHDGSLQYETTPGEGTTFRMTLPRAPS